MSAPFTANINFLELTFGRGAAIWWAYSWRAGIYIVGISSLLGFVMGLSPMMVQLVTMIVSVPVGIYILQHVFRMSFGDFAIRLVPRASGDSE